MDEKNVDPKEEVKKKVGGFFSDFWKFAAKGNVMDLAVAVLLGNAFTAVVNSVANDILSPFVSLATNNVDFTNLKYVIREPAVLAGTTTPALTVAPGHLIQVTMNFFIVALMVFLMFKLISAMRARLEKNEEKEPAHPVSTEEKLLSEIRDILKKQTPEEKKEGVHSA